VNISSNEKLLTVKNGVPEAPSPFDIRSEVVNAFSTSFIKSSMSSKGPPSDLISMLYDY